jgi:hypothetical protein
VGAMLARYRHTREREAAIAAMVMRWAALNLLGPLFFILLFLL